MQLSTILKLRSVTVESYEFNVSGTSLKRFLADVYGEVSYSDLKYDKKLGYNQAQATAEQVMDYLKNSRFYVSEDYPEEMAYKITVVRYAMSENSYQKYIATTIASDVSEESVAYVSENASKLQGVEVIDDTIRKYNDAEYFASIIGYTGKISTEEYESLSADNDNYTLNDVVGKAGIEQVMDASLQGTKGYEKLYVDYLGKAVEVLEREEPSAGNDVYLSIDKNLQIAAYDLLEQEIAGIVYSNIESSGSEMNIPITDVYFALVNNNVIDIEHFSDENATGNEKSCLTDILRQAANRPLVSDQRVKRYIPDSVWFTWRGKSGLFYLHYQSAEGEKNPSAKVD